MNYRAEIDGLRALAVLSVLGYHFLPQSLPNGGLGVDVFFVISGFVITASLYNQSDQSLRQFLVRFFTRRIKRLLPALLLMVFVTSLLIPFLDPFPKQSINSGISAIIGFSNVYLYSVEQDYFGPTSELNPFTHTWSLGVEEQFYFLFPLLFWFGWRLRGWFGVTTLLAVLATASFIAWLVVFNEDPLAAFYIVFFRFWQIAFGVLTFLAQMRAAQAPNPIKPGLIKTIAIVFVAFVLVLPVSIDLQVATLITTLGTCAVLYWVRPDVRQMWILKAGLSRYFGRISYSLYLWHWPVVVILAWTVGEHMGLIALGVASSIVLAHLSWVFIEQPLRHAKWSLVPLRELMIGLATMMIAVGALSFYNAIARDVAFGKPLDIDASLGRSSLFLPYVSDNGTVWAGRDCTLVNNDDIGKIIDIERCAVSEPLENAQSRVLIIGNSFAPAFAAAYDIQEIYQGPTTSFILSAKFGASPVPDIEWRSHSVKATVDYWERVVPGLFDVLQPGDEVLIISDLAKLSPKKHSDWADQAREDLRKGLVELSAQLAQKEVGLSILGPLPFLRDARCTPEMALRQWHSAELSLCKYYNRKETIERFQPVSELLTSLADDGTLRVLDLFDVFCPDDVCAYTDQDGVLLYRDIYSHASETAARRARPLVARWLTQVHGNAN